MAMQIGHLGRQDIPELRDSAPIAPSAIPINNGGIVPRVMTLQDIDDIVEKFAQVCRRVKVAGLMQFSFMAPMKA